MLRPSIVELSFLRDGCTRKWTQHFPNFGGLSFDSASLLQSCVVTAHQVCVGKQNHLEGEDLLQRCRKLAESKLKRFDSKSTLFILTS